MSISSQIFGLTSATAYVAGKDANIADISSMLQQMAVAFGGSTSDGIYTYNLFTSLTGLLTTNGFNSSSIPWVNLTGTVANYESFYPANIGISSLIYAFATFPNLLTEYQTYYVNKYDKLIYQLYYGNSQNQLTIFTDTIVQTLISQLQLNTLNQIIGSSPDNSYNKMVNYNWYDTTSLFNNSNSLSQLIKDVENQYYYLTGELRYDPLPTGLMPCIQKIININTPTGIIESNIILNVPCYENGSYIGPISGIKFSRIINDGPPTSGYFDPPTTNEYINFDKVVLSSYDYSSNNVNLYSYQQDSGGNYIAIFSGINIDIPGVYNQNAEYGFGETNLITNDEICDWGAPPMYNDTGGNPLPYMSMHQGDNKPKLWYDISNTIHGCVITTGLYNWTGWKLVDFEVDISLLPQFFTINTNPQINVTRLLKRILNIDSGSPYSEVGDTGDGVLSCLQYVGPPQLNGNSTLPGFVFYQTFDNQHFPSLPTGTYASIVIRPALSTSTQGTSYSTSNREFSSNISQYNILSGFSNVHPPLTQKLTVPLSGKYNSLQMANYDDIFQKCLAIGDGFGGVVTFTGTQEWNDGFAFNKYIYTLSGNPINANELLKEYNTVILGSKYQTVKYLTGYQDTNGITYNILKQQSLMITGNNSVTGAINYYYFNTNHVIGAVNTGWESFAPIPNDVILNPQNYTGFYVTQNVENYLPRYLNGPFITYNTSFLYPNAQAITSIYDTPNNGFPTGFNYILNVKEETVKEAYLLSGFNNYIVPISIIRAISGSPFNLGTSMITPFVANNFIYQFTYNFNTNHSLYPDNGNFAYSAELAPCVNAYYVPNSNGCPQLILNNSEMVPSFGNFNCGVRMTGQFVNRIIYTGTGGAFTNFSNPEPLINGLYWGYNGYQRSGVITYVPPIYNIAAQSMDVTPEMSGALFNNQKVGYTTATFSNNGKLRYADLIDSNSNYNGKDPISYEYVGGRSGITSNQDGGYNDLGIIGDSWYDFTAGNWGQSFYYCYPYPRPYRWPEFDSTFVLLSLVSTGINIYTRALQYNPYYLNWKYTPYVLPFLNIGINNVNPVKRGNEYYFNFNLKNIFPLINITGAGLYSSTGVSIGPFPLDSELCITGGCSIVPSGDFYIDGEMIASSNTNNFTLCVLNPVEGFTLNSGIILNENNRSPVLSTFKLVPSSGIINFNLSGTGAQKLGFSGDSIVTIRPRTVFGQISNSSYDSTLLSGDGSIMDGFRYIDNGNETIYSIPNNNQKFENLVGKPFVFETIVNNEVLFPIPGSDFISILSGNGLVSSDTFGNLIFNLSNGGPTYQYWKIKTPNIQYTGFREISRISFELVQLNPLYGPPPYQTFQTLIPSGECTINAVFGYSGEAESAVVTKGIILSGVNYPSLNSGILEPIYVSDVLQRLPTGIQILPSGSGIYPVLSAPSYMQERQNYSIILGGDTYIPVAPTGTNYNRFLWPALSDLATFNPSLTYEQLPPDDGEVFLTDNLTFSASQGQQIISGVFNLTENVTYEVLKEYIFLDSTSTNALYNTGTALFNDLPSNVYLDSGNLSGILAPEGISLTIALEIQ